MILEILEIKKEDILIQKAWINPIIEYSKATQELKNNFNIRSQFEDEVILDSDDGKYEEVKTQLIKDKIIFTMWKTNGKNLNGHHFHLFFPEMKAYSDSFKKIIRKNIIKKYGCDEKMIVNKVAVENRNHHKTNKKKELIYENNTKKKIYEIGNKLPEWSLKQEENVKNQYDTTNKVKCLWHEDYDPSLSINLEKGICYCHGCEISATYEAYLAKKEGRIEEITEKNTTKGKKHYYIKKNYELDITELYQNITLKKYNAATEMIVEAIEKQEYIYTTRDEEKSEMWIYNNGIYTPNARTYIKEYCRDILRKAHTPQLTNKVIYKIESDTYIEQEILFREADINYIPIENGLLNLKTKKLESFTPKKRFFSKLPIKYNKQADCPNIKKHLKQVLKNPEEDMLLFQELIGFMLLRDYKFEKAFILSGNGRNGKSKTLELIKKFLGINNCINVSLQRLESKSFVISEFHKKLGNLADDIGKKQLYETESFKSLVGRGMVSAERKFKTTVSFTNYAKFIFCANEIPRTCDNTDAFFDRWCGLEFPYKFIPKNEYDLLEDKGNCKIQNPEQINKISSEEEISGLLNWALEGLERLNKQKGFTENQTSKDIKNFWVRKSDSFKAFCIDHIEECYENSISKDELRRQYAFYCRKHKSTPTGDKHIKKILLEEYGAWEDRESLGDRLMVWKGIILKSVKDVKDVKGFQNGIILKSRVAFNSKTLDKSDKSDGLKKVLDEKPIIEEIDMTEKNKIDKCGNLVKIIEKYDSGMGVSENTLSKFFQGNLIKCLDSLQEKGLIFSSKPGIWRFNK